ncbi:MAG: glucose-6-phosphate isomerase [Chloroflexi bacterium]|nr:glucose-6-phosphate isomerase [Chloroflexota bacterium]
MEERSDLAGLVRGIWECRPATWTDDTTHHASIANRLGWLDVASDLRHRADDLAAFAGEVRREGFTHALLLGMGGSSLAPEVLRRTFGVRPGYLDLAVLDSTDPHTVLDYQRRLPWDKTLFIVSTKSGTTTETLSFERFYYEHVRQHAGDGPNGAGRQFIAITDAGTPLEHEAARLGFRRTFLNPEDIGGRYSALSYFGLAPAALIGVDVAALLDRAIEAMRECAAEAPIEDNVGAQLGAALARAAANGRDKVTLVYAHPFKSLGYWVEQLIAESTGKEGKGLLPVEGETLGPPDVYGDDRIFVAVGVDVEAAERLRALEREGHLVVRLPAAGPLDLGYQFFTWEFATAVVGASMRINPFDEPNVQESKDHTSRVLQAYETAGRLPAVPEVEVGDAATHALATLLRQAQPGDYLAVLAFVPRTKETEAALSAWRLALRDHLKVATTLGFGPRYLHSTGQWHKGGPDTGVFVQLVSDDLEDAPIPGAPYSFGTLKQAQAIGDLQALRARERRVLRIRLSGDIPDAVHALAVASVPLFPIWEAAQNDERTR